MRPRLPILGTILVGTAICGVAIARLPHVSLTTAALVAAAAIVTELFEEASRERLREPIASDRLQLAAGVQIAAVLLLGPLLGGLIAAVGVLGGVAARPRNVVDACFRSAAFASASAAAGVAFRIAGGRAGAPALLEDLIPFAAAGLGYLTVRAVLVDVVGRRESFDPRLASALGEISFGSAVALLAARHPWDVVALVPLALAIHQAQASVVRVQRETLRALETFANIVDERDPSTYRHSVRVAAYVDELARALRLPFSEIDRLRWAGRLHDLGKVAVDSTVLRKAGRLSAAEWAAVRRHPRLSARLLQRFEFVATQARAVELHHERVDGRGYYGVRDDDLPLAAHFLIVADSYDAMTTDRPYRRGVAKEEALAEIERNLGTQFHAAVGKAFVAVQRGLDPTVVLTPEELGEIRAAHAAYRFEAVPTGAFRRRPELLTIGGVVAALVALAFDEPRFAIAAAAAAVAGGVLMLLARARAERLARLLRSALHASNREEVFARFTERVRTVWPLEWAALVTWDEDGLGGRVDRHEGAAVDRSALIGWLVRQADSGLDLVAASPADLPSEGAPIALPLRHETSQLAGFVVLAGAVPPPQALELAFLETLDDLGLALADRPASGGRDGADAEPLETATDSLELALVRLHQR